MTRHALVACLFLMACGPDSRRDDGTGGGGGGGGGEGVDAFATTSPNGQQILMLDFRSGWWAGSAGEFHKTVLDPLRNAGTDITIEFHHLTVGSDVKCI